MTSQYGGVRERAGGITRAALVAALAATTMAVAGVAIGMAGPAGASPTGASTTVGPTNSASTPHWPANPDWQRYVVAPKTSDVQPVRVVQTAGHVTGADGLAASGAGGTAHVTLTMRSGGPAPSVVVDYDKDVGGVPYFSVTSVSGTPTLRATYSEARQYLGQDGDRSPSASAAGAGSRVTTMAVAYPGRLSAGLIQGGERYERIALSSPGSITLSGVGIDFTALRTTAADYRGWFDSSSSELDRIYYDGAYTTQLDELPVNAVPPSWRVSSGALDAVDGSIGSLGQGADWTDYTLSVDIRVVHNGADWVVRAPSSSSGYLFVLHQGSTSGGRGSTRASLQEIALGPTEFDVLGDVPLARGFDTARWHRVTTAVDGPEVRTSIDGRPVASFDTGSLPSGASDYASGTIGLGALGASAMFRDLVVTAADGATLYANQLADPAALTDFPGPDVTSPDPRPMIMDGARRDRVVWSGDLGVEIPTVLATTDGTDYARSSLQLLGSYQVASGESGTNIDPTAPLGTFPETATPFSVSYSMDEVDNIATYYLDTGDLSFVQAEWPMITRELAYNASLVGTRGLLVTDRANGNDWDHYDRNKTGAVTAFNAIYYRTLTDAAAMAEALGSPVEAAAYRLQAARVKAAVNRYLFDRSTGLYRLSDHQPAAVAQDGNSLAVLFGVAPKRAAGTVLQKLAKALPSTPYGPESFSKNAGNRPGVSPFITNEEVQALFATGDTNGALALIDTLWGHMDASGPDDSSADWELVSATGAPGLGSNTSLAHGWSSGPTVDLAAYVLGVQPITAGYRTWSVAPQLGSLAWAEGSVPTPGGSITVRWARDRSSGHVAMEVNAPAGTTGTISVPVPRSGGEVTIRRMGTGSGGTPASVRSVTAPPGTGRLSVATTGGATYELTVMPDARG